MPKLSREAWSRIAGVEAPQPTDIDPLRRSALIRRPVRTIAAGIVLGALGIFGLVILLGVLTGLLALALHWWHPWEY